MKNGLKRKKNNRSFSTAEQSGMKQLLSGIKKARETATGKPCVALSQACDRLETIKRISD